MPDQIITKDGYQKLKDELDVAVNTKRREIAKRIQKAKDMGDLSENAEYSEAKDAQAFNEGRVAEITTLLKTVTVVESDGDGHVVGMGSKITVLVNGKEKVYTIVSFNEVDPMEGKISNESPLGQAFIGKKVGEEITIETPRGESIFKLKKIE